jgi:hypothetical protein
MLVILMSVVTFTVSAQAHCAWVLWSGTLTEPMNWYPVDAFTSRDECQGRLEVVRRHVSGIYKCLPDTIDARGPRTSGWGLVEWTES